MDLALAIWEINPKATYNINHYNADGTQVLLEWRGPGSEPTAQELRTAWDTYEARKNAEDAAEVQKEADKQLAISEMSKTPEGQQILKAMGITPV